MKPAVTPSMVPASTSAPLCPYNWLPVLLCLLLSVFAPVALLAQDVRIRGRITSEAGQPAANVTVQVKGTSIATSTDAAGNYSITAPSNGTLVISSVGFGTKEISINGRQTLDIALATVISDLDQVVVVGYGTQRRRDVTGAVVSVNEKTLKEVPAPNVIAQLKGRTPGQPHHYQFAGPKRCIGWSVAGIGWNSIRWQHQ
jgi:hypothetical protein